MKVTFLMKNLKHIIACMWILGIAVAYIKGVEIGILIPFITGAIATYFAGKWHQSLEDKDNCLTTFGSHVICDEFKKFKELSADDKVVFTQIDDNVFTVSEKDKPNKTYFVMFDITDDMRPCVKFIDISNTTLLTEILNKK